MFLLACSACPVSALATDTESVKTEEDIIIDGITYSFRSCVWGSNCGSESFEFKDNHSVGILYYEGIVDGVTSIIGIEDNEVLFNVPQDVVFDGMTYSFLSGDDYKTIYVCESPADGCIYVACVYLDDGEVKYNVIPDVIYDEVTGLTFSHVGYWGFNLGYYECLESPVEGVTYAGKVQLDNFEWKPESFHHYVMIDGVKFYYAQGSGNSIAYYGLSAIYYNANFTSKSFPSTINGFSVVYPNEPFFKNRYGDLLECKGNITVDGFTYFPHMLDDKIIGYELIAVDLEDTSIRTIDIPTEVNGIPVLFYENISAQSYNPVVTVKGLDYDPYIYYNRSSHKISILDFNIHDVDITNVEEVYEKVEDFIESARKGDATGDGEVSITDVVLANKVVLGKEAVTDSQYQALDIDNDNIVSASDALSVMQYVVGLVDSLD
ncbi:MAG: dockerin type I repeat-containing protein [Oscillospiraceae bacterium]|nr:dockerin type I repeat-containing protein [Oscillospiraceae bacterium]